VSKRLDFNKNTGNNYDYGEFLHNGGLFRIINALNTKHNTKLDIVPEIDNDHPIIPKTDVILQLSMNKFNHLIKPLVDGDGVDIDIV
jgi:hypothetical protein